MRSALRFLLVPLALAALPPGPASATTPDDTCSPDDPVEAHVVYPPDDAVDVPTDATFLVAVPRGVCGRDVLPDEVSIALSDLEGTEPAAIAATEVADGDPLRHLGGRLLLVRPEEPLRAEAGYRLNLSSAGWSAQIDLGTATGPSPLVAPARLAVDDVESDGRWVTVTFDAEPPAASSGLLFVALEPEGGGARTALVAPSFEPGGVATASFRAPDEAGRACVIPTLRAPEGTLVEGEATCFERGGGCSAAPGRPTSSGVVVAGLLAAVLARRRRGGPSQRR